jgi:hypothetical protein
MTVKHPMLHNRPQDSAPMGPSLNPYARGKAPPSATPVYDVRPPSEEELFNAQMEQAEAQYAEAQINPAPIMTDEMFQAQLQKKEAINKLVMLREPMTKVVGIDGQSFRIRLINPNDSAKIVKALQDTPEEERMARARVLALCAVLMDVDGIKIEDIYSGPKEQNDPFWQRYWEISLWPSLLVNRLFDAMDEFSASIEKRYADSFLK